MCVMLFKNTKQIKGPNMSQNQVLKKKSGIFSMIRPLPFDLSNYWISPILSAEVLMWLGAHLDKVLIDFEVDIFSKNIDE